MCEWIGEIVSTSSNKPSSDEVDLLLLNARLRDELEPFIDESFDLLATKKMSLAAENEFLASMLAWERAPMLPISKWFEPELKLRVYVLIAKFAVTDFAAVTALSVLGLSDNPSLHPIK
jgi:hypothetical protein